MSDPDAAIPPSVAHDLVDWVTENDRPASWLTRAPDPELGELLIRLGAHPERTGNWCGADLADLDLRRLDGSEVEIEAVLTDADLADWLDVADACGWLGPHDRSSRARLYDEIGLAEGPLRHWVARVDQLPVGFASSMIDDSSSRDSTTDGSTVDDLTIDGGVVELCNLGVLAPFRRRGIGRALALHRLRAAAEAGVAHAVAAPSQGGWELHRTLGFTLAPVIPDVCFYLEPRRDR